MEDTATSSARLNPAKCLLDMPTEILTKIMANAVPDRVNIDAACRTGLGGFSRTGRIVWLQPWVPSMLLICTKISNIAGPIIYSRIHELRLVCAEFDKEHGTWFPEFNRWLLCEWDSRAVWAREEVMQTVVDSANHLHVVLMEKYDGGTGERQVKAKKMSDMVGGHCKYCDYEFAHLLVEEGFVKGAAPMRKTFVPRSSYRYVPKSFFSLGRPSTKKRAR